MDSSKYLAFIEKNLQDAIEAVKDNREGQVADYKTPGRKAVPSDVAKTSLTEKFLQPRGTKNVGQIVQSPLQQYSIVYDNYTQ